MKILIILLMMFSSQVMAEVSLMQIDDFGTNPGNLKMYAFKPKQPNKNTSLVVLLHGCAQVATDFDNETGWTKIAEDKGLYLLLPQQKEDNNNWRCFNWFEKGDNRRGEGEIASIIEMIDHMVRSYGINHKKIFVLGLSAGGAMTSNLLATYPNYFKAAAIIAGVSSGCASNVMDAYSCMYGFKFPIPSSKQRGDFVRSAAGDNYQGPWPKVMVIHGTSDEFVNYKNANDILDQWSNVHNIDTVPDRTLMIDGQTQTFYQNESGEDVLSLISIKNQKHGYPISSKENCGVVGKYIIDSGVCASKYISTFFNL